MLACPQCTSGPKHVFGCIKKRIPAELLPELNDLEERMKVFVREHAKDRNTIAGIGDNWMASTLDSLMKGPWRKDRRLF